MSKTLHLNLKKKWFDMVLSGEKKEEYRDIKESMISKFLINKETKKTPIAIGIRYSRKDYRRSYFYMRGYLKGRPRYEVVQTMLNEKTCEYKEFDTITFSNGYKKDRPQFEIELKSIKIDSGKTEWGAIENEKYFVLELGEILKTEGENE